MSKQSDFLERFQEFKIRLLKATSNSILRNTIQFFYDDADNLPAAFGSGLLISLDNRFFMVTAAHIIAENYNNIFIILPTKELQLGGQLYFTPMPSSGNRNDDTIDIAIMELEPKVTSEVLLSFEFIQLENIELDHQLHENQYYLSVGYPGERTNIIDKEIKAIPFPYQTEADLKFAYETEGFNKSAHIAVKFDGYVTSASDPSPHEAPALGGISGSGLWYLNDFATPNMIKNKKLIGIITTQYNSKNSEVIIATRIEVVTEAIRQKFEIDIPKSKSVKVNIF